MKIIIIYTMRVHLWIQYNSSYTAVSENNIIGINDDDYEMIYYDEWVINDYVILL